MSNHAQSNWHIDGPSEGSNNCPATDRHQLIPLRHVGFYQLRQPDPFECLDYEKRRAQKRTRTGCNDTNGFEPVRAQLRAARYSAVPTASYYDPNRQFL